MVGQSLDNNGRNAVRSSALRCTDTLKYFKDNFKCDFLRNLMQNLRPTGLS